MLQRWSQNLPTDSAVQEDETPQRLDLLYGMDADRGSVSDRQQRQDCEINEIQQRYSQFWRLVSAKIKMIHSSK